MMNESESANDNRSYLLPNVGVVVTVGDLATLFIPDHSYGRPVFKDRMHLESVRGLLKGALACLPEDVNP